MKISQPFNPFTQRPKGKSFASLAWLELGTWHGELRLKAI
jgi:hypothetical protein